jgi:catechol 2,3-dioxygenase-like lactoylglutathione lyase family enzyme
MTLNIVRRPVKKFPVNPRIRAYGKARLDIASRIQNPSDWEKLWKKPTFPFPFTWGSYWKQCIEYKVDDFAAEVGFYTDILGLPVNALDPGYAMFTSPGGDFFIAIIPTPAGAHSTPPDAIRIQFMVADLFPTVKELEHRGISMEQWPQPCAIGSNLYIGYFRTPHGICVDLWGLVEVRSSNEQDLPPASGTMPESSVSQAIAQAVDDISDIEDEVEIEVPTEEDIPAFVKDEAELQTEEVQPVYVKNGLRNPDLQVGMEELIEVEYVDEETP